MSSTPKKNRRRHLIILLGGPALILAAGIYLYVFGDRYAVTDNAYTKRDKIGISAQINGRVETVNVTDNAKVSRGQVLFTIEKEPFEIAAAQAEANLANARANIESLKADYLQKKAELSKAQDTVAYQQREYNRYAQLLKTNTIARAKFDEVSHNLNDASNSRDALNQELASVAAKLGGGMDTPIEENPLYKQALAVYKKTQLDLTYIEVKSPIDGIAANVTLKPGEYIAAGLPVFSVVDNSHVWVEANFKETDLTHVIPGQKAIVKIDLYPGRKWNGVVSSITPATGSEFSILPSENSSGNWVKVVQRVMVRIELTDYNGTPLIPAGVSSNIKIDTGKNRLQRMGSKE